MRKIRKLSIGFFLLGAFLALAILFPKPEFKRIEILSPLPRVLGANDDATTLATFADIWSPTGYLKTNQPPPEVTARAAFFVDLDSRKIIYEKNPREKRPVASLVKIMTALLALEKGDLNQVLTVNHYAASVGEDSMYASEGEKYTLRELLYGLMLNSANDAAETIASGLASDRSEFIRWMNARAKELGLRDTHFINPSGLDDGGGDYSTAYDILIIARTAIEKFPIFSKITSTYDKFLPECIDHKAVYLGNETNLLTTYPGCFGVKTGYTPRAGLCLVTAAKRGSHRVLGVLLDSGDRRGEAKILLDYSFKVMGVVE